MVEVRSHGSGLQGTLGPQTKPGANHFARMGVSSPVPDRYSLVMGTELTLLVAIQKYPSYNHIKVNIKY